MRSDRLTALAALAAAALLTSSIALPSAAGAAASSGPAQQRWVKDWSDMKNRTDGNVYGAGGTIGERTWENGLGTASGTSTNGARVSFDTRRCTKVRFGVTVDDFQTTDETRPARVVVTGRKKTRTGSKTVVLTNVRVGPSTERNLRPIDISRYTRVTFDLVFNDDSSDDVPDTVIPEVGGPEFRCR